VPLFIQYPVYPAGGAIGPVNLLLWLISSIVVLGIGLVSVSDEADSGFYFKTTTVGISINCLCISGFTHFL